MIKYGMLVWVMVGLLAGVPGAAAKDVEVFPEHSNILGKTIGQWSAEWWKWATAIPKSQNPLLDGDCNANQSGLVFFLGASLGGKVERSCTIPSSTMILVPLVSDIEFAPDFCAEFNGCAAKANAIIAQVSVLTCEIDRQEVADLGNHREDTPAEFAVDLPADNIFGFDPGRKEHAAAAGYWLMIRAPLPPGEHTIHWHVVVGPPAAPIFESDITYHLTTEFKVYPPHAVVDGKSLGDWSAEWWKWYLGIPGDPNNALDLDSTIGQGPGEVFFLAGNGGGSSVRSCKIACGRKIFFPLLDDVEIKDISHCSDCPSCSALARSAIEGTSFLSCEIDGVAVEDLGDHREVPSSCFGVVLPPENWLGAPPGLYEISSADGYYLMLDPLCPGEHTVRFQAKVGEPASPLFEIDVTYHLTAEPELYAQHSVVSEMSLGDWSAEWWKWALSYPKDQNPILDDSGARSGLGQREGDVFFLAGNYGGLTVRAGDVPCDQNIFFPVVNDFEVDGSGCSGCSGCSAVANTTIKGVTYLACEVDGVDVPDLGDHRETPGACFMVTLPPDNILGLPPGDYGPATSDGFWVMLKPLCPGEHIVRFETVIGDAQNPMFALDLTYFLNILPCTAGPGFRRGDYDGSGMIELTDVVNLLGYLFLGDVTPACLDAGDADDSGAAELTDAINILGYLFLGNPGTLPEPSNCGRDVNPPSLGCDVRCP
jgi:hypothetical protein